MIGVLCDHHQQIEHQYKGIIVVASNHDVNDLVAFYYTIYKDAQTFTGEIFSNGC